MNFDPFGPALSPFALAVTGGLVWLYARGAGRSRLVGERIGPVRHLLFGIGALLLAAAFNSPLAPAGQRLFSLHQVQHLLIRLIGPMLIVLAHPRPVLLAGLPRHWRYRLRDATAAVAMPGATAPVARLPVAFVLLVASLWLWQVPALHNAALAVPALALVAHLGMALAGLLFFAIVFDRRDAPAGAIQSLRLLALVAVIVSNILLGSLTTLKTTVLYTGYGFAERLWGVTPLADETIGGYTIWLPSSMVIIVAIILVFSGWNAVEIRRWNARYDRGGSNTAALDFPETAQELRLKVADPNRRMGRTLALAALAMFGIVMVTAITIVSLG